MQGPTFSTKGRQLLELYERMAREGYVRSDDRKVAQAFSDFELRPYRAQLRPVLREHGVGSLLDYGSGGSDWEAAGFDEATGQSARDYFGLREALRYEPARGLDERRPVDCVVSFDVLEHVFIADVPAVLRDMLSLATRLLVLNVACYPAAARLPNGENAHVTVRPPAWWKGMLDAVAVEFPSVSVLLICSTAWRRSTAYPVWRTGAWLEGEAFGVAF
ncbi:MAG: hypothetical protein U0P81_10345 [Holophagaceae bacterium]